MVMTDPWLWYAFGVHGNPQKRNILKGCVPTALVKIFVGQITTVKWYGMRLQSDQTVLFTKETKRFDNLYIVKNNRFFYV